MMKKYTRSSDRLIRILIFVVVGMLAGCASLPDTQEPGTHEPAPSQTEPAASRTARPTLRASTGTPIPTPTGMLTTPQAPVSTSTPELPCPARETGLPPGFLAPGMLAFIDSQGVATVSELKDTLYSLSSPELELHPFMDDLDSGTLWHFSVSPDGNWLAFRQERQQDQGYVRDLFVTTSDDQERKTIPWNAENWGELMGWLADGQHLIIVPRYGFGDTWRDEIVLFNPFTGQQRDLQPSFTGVEESFLYWWWGKVGLSVVFDPTLTRVAYLEGIDTLVLWDLENERELWRFKELALMQDEMPTWSPKGSFLVVVDVLGEHDAFGLEEGAEFQILLASRDGEIIWQSAPLPFYEEWHQSLGSFTWSPDERYLSFVWSVPERDETRTFILDTNSMQVLDYCLTETVSTPVWSPDSQQFIVWAVKSKAPDGETTWQNLVVDVSKKVAVQLEEVTLRPVAWLRTDP